MSFLFSSPTPTYATEQLTAQLSSLSTLPVNLTSTSTKSLGSSSDIDKPSPVLQSALSELSASKPPGRDNLQRVLETLVKSGKDAGAYVVQSEMDRVVEGEVLGRAVTVLWKEVIADLMTDALEIEREREWWDSVLNSRSGVGIYLVQSELSP